MFLRCCKWSISACQRLSILAKAKDKSIFTAEIGGAK
jgi:hypothetical protein